ncbi:MAG: Wzz/FepE/Etk N-terminal domain-containing protein [Lachnospiraceae bacterium]|nr:Wzz/FepE/Etk N-terminal domain-containing protein [Lachnospiraceae bacterium]
MNEKYINNNEDEIDLLELLFTYLQNWWVIAMCAISGAVIAMAVTIYLITPKYESTAMLYILNKTTSITSLADIQVGDALTEDFGVIAKSKPVLDNAIEKIEKEEDKKFTREEILDMLTISSESRILTVQVVSENAEDACMVANAMAEAISEQIASIMKSDPPTTVERAEISAEPVSPSLKKNVLIGFLAGMVLICAVLTVIFIANDRIKTQEDVEKYLDVPTLAVVPYIHEKERKRESRTKNTTVK